MNRRLSFLSLVFGILVILLSTDATAAKVRTLQGRIYFRNERVHYDNSIGSKLTKINNYGEDQSSLSYIAYQVVSYCNGSYYWGTKNYAAENGFYSQTYSFADSCDAPMFLMIVWFESQVSDKSFHRVTNLSGSLYNTVITKNGDWFKPNFSATTSVWQSVNLSCPSDWDWRCYGSSDSHYYATTHKVSNLYRSGIDVALAWGVYHESSSSAITLEWPHPSGSSYSSGYDLLKMSEETWKENHRVAHEFGHTYHRRAMGYSGALSLSEWCSGHSWHHDPNGNMSETCATAEGWANFFAAATYFTRDADYPFYRFCGDNCDGVFDTTTCNCGTYAQNAVPQACERRCVWRSAESRYRRAQQNLEGDTWDRAWNPGTTNLDCVRQSNADRHAIEGNVARFFWDLYDSYQSTEPEDRTSVSENIQFLNIWKNFLDDGYGDKQSKEPRCPSETTNWCPHNCGVDDLGNPLACPYKDVSGDVWDDKNGRNAKDFGKISNIDETRWNDILDHNCLDGQDDI